MDEDVIERLLTNNGFTNSLILEEKANRVHIEFYCQECKHYLYIWLPLNLSGNHIINCPNCEHKHYRVVKGGRIMGDRFDENLKNHEIVCPKSACVAEKDRRVRGLIARIREREAVGLHT